MSKKRPANIGAEVRIYDYLDESVPMLARMYKRRLRGYKSIGYEITDSENTN